MEDPPEDVDDAYLALEDLPPDSLVDSDSAEGSISADGNEADTPPQTLHQNKGQPPEPKEEEQTGEHGSSFIDNETIFRVENILGTCIRNRTRQYLVKWEGYPSTENTWEPEENILDDSLIENFYASKNNTGFNCISICRVSLLSLSQLVKPSLFFFTLLILFLGSFSQPQLGPLYDCSRVHELEVFHLNYRKVCQHNMRDSTQPISYFSVKVHRPYIYRTPISILMCSSEIRTLRCKESFSGQNQNHQL